MAARIDHAGTIFQLDRPAEPDELVAEDDVKDASKLARLLVRILKDIATLKRRYWPRRIDFEDRAIASTTTSYRFTHNMNARVRWWLVDWAPTSASANHVPLFAKSSDTDLNTLVLSSLDAGLGRFAGTISVRVEAA